MQLLRCQQGKAFFKVKAHLVTEHRSCPGAGTVTAVNAFSEYTVQKIKILLHETGLWAGLKEHRKGRMAGAGNQVAMAAFPRV